jgi:hypothetical protein
VDFLATKALKHKEIYSYRGTPAGSLRPNLLSRRVFAKASFSDNRLSTIALYSIRGRARREGLEIRELGVRGGGREADTAFIP